MNRNFLKLTGAMLLALSFVMCRQQPAAHEDDAKVETCNVSTPQEAIAELMAGNERYVNGKSIHPRADLARVQETAPHQAPFAAVVGCSDSRVPVELLFDQCRLRHRAFGRQASACFGSWLMRRCHRSYY